MLTVVFPMRVVVADKLSFTRKHLFHLGPRKAVLRDVRRIVFVPVELRKR